MQWQRFWRVVLTGMILVGLWWWTTVSAGADDPTGSPTAPPQLMPANVHTAQFDACNPPAWWASIPAGLNPCTATADSAADSVSPATVPLRTGLRPR